MFRFLHAADIHLDSPLQGLERYPEAPVEAVRGAPRRAFAALVDLALEERVAFVLLAGDLYDGDWKDYNTGLFFVAQMRRLAEAGIPAFLVSGNHDAVSQITKRLSLPDNVRHFGATAPETGALDDLDVAIHGQSFGARRVADDLSAAFPSADPARFEIGLLHTSLDGRPGHADYAPCTVEGLRSKGYGYWALGHVHRAERVCTDPWIVYPGNLQGRHARETGAKGCTIVCVEAGRVARVESRALDVVRWARVELDLAPVDHVDDAIELARVALESTLAASEGRLLAARLVLSGRTRIHDALARGALRFTHELRGAAASIGGAGVWLERVEIATRAERNARAIAARGDALADLLGRIDAIAESEGKAEVPALPARTALAELEDLKRRLPPGFFARAQSGASDELLIDPTDPTWLRARMGAVRELLFARLLEHEGEP